MLRSLLCLALFASLPLPALAQDSSGTSEEDAARKRAERRLRTWRSLELTDAQKKQVIDLLVAEEKATNKATETRRKKMKAILDGDQRKKYQEMLDRWNNRNRGNRGGQGGQARRGGGNSRLRWVGLDAARYAPLNLDAEQKEKLDAELKVAGERLSKAYAEQRGKRWNYDKWRAFALTLRGEVRPKIASMLTEEQKTKFDEINKKYDDEVNRYYQRYQERQKQRAEREKARKEGRKAETAAEEIARLLKAATKDLGLGDEEASVITPMIEKLIRHKVLGRRALAQRRESVGKVATDEGPARAQLAHYRREAKEYQAKLGTLQGEVRELLTVEQEARLVALDLLP